MDKKIQQTSESFITLIDHMHRIDPVDKPPGTEQLSPAVIQMVLFIRRHQGCRIQDVAEGLRLAKPTVSLGIGRLESEGICLRKVDAFDGRAVNLYLTDSGVMLSDRIDSYRREKVYHLLDKLTGVELEQFQILLERLHTDTGGSS